MTEPDTEFKYVAHADVAAHEADGWRVCKGWRNAGHHTIYSIPMERDVHYGDDLTAALRRMAARSRKEGEALLAEAAQLEASAAEIERRPRYDTVPIDAVADALVIDPVPTDMQFGVAGKLPTATGSALKVDRAPKRASERVRKLTLAALQGGATTAPAMAEAAQISEAHVRRALREFVAEGVITRSGPPLGPGVSYRLAMDRKEVVPNRPENRITLAEGGPAHTTAPAVIPPAAPTCEHCGGPRHPGSAKLCRACYRAGVAACAEVAAPPVDNTPGARLIDMLKEAGPHGVPSRTLRTESGLHVMVYKGLISTLLEAGRIEALPPAQPGAEKIYRLRATKDLQTDAAQA